MSTTVTLCHLKRTEAAIKRSAPQLRALTHVALTRTLHADGRPDYAVVLCRGAALEPSGLRPRSQWLVTWSASLGYAAELARALAG